MSVFSGVRTKVGIVSGAVLLAGLGIGATSGTAAAASGDCPEGWLCVWVGENYTGRMQKVQYDNADLSMHTVFANGFRSAFNNGNSCDVQVYGGKNYTKSLGTLKRGQKGSSDEVTIKVLSNKWVNCR
ncbi:peptidase inhibitor family I36 protein [Streptomyces luteogriseus]|uniref:peptidase inhibitor family I36 protein n=1 Tax=Streptomyces TaxID=1883 RepID=UPI0004CBFCDC|nr:peptidase inhibitor family I36 protein [Streptomyces sp. NRRL S-475]